MKSFWLVIPVLVCGAGVAGACGGSTGESGDSGADVAVDTGAMDAAPACAAPEKMCGTACTNVETDNANCGSCGNACPSGQVCAGGTCALTCGSLTTCTGDAGAPYCANTKTDNANCGACGTTCAAGKVCDNGTCSLTCGSLTTCKPDGGAPYCANTQTDDANCGTCGNACPSGQTCQSGKCAVTCGSLTTCKPDGGAPYCANTQSDNANCGTCGTVCAAGESCVGGTCQLPVQGCAGLSDPDWSNVITYVSCNGSSITDSSGKSTLTTYNIPTISTTPAGAPGGSSCSLGYAGTYDTANGFKVDLPSALGTGDFTVEIAVYQTAWYEPSDQASNLLVSSSAYPPDPGGFPTFFSNDTATELQFVPGTGAAVYMDPGSALSTWELYAASRVAGVTYLFRNGTLLTSFADTSNYADTTFFVGHQMNGAYNAVVGSVGQIRVTTVGRYTSSYTPCSGAFATQ